MAGTERLMPTPQDPMDKANLVRLAPPDMLGLARLMTVNSGYGSNLVNQGAPEVGRANSITPQEFKVATEWTDSNLGGTHVTDIPPTPRGTHVTQIPPTPRQRPTPSVTGNHAAFVARRVIGEVIAPS